MSELPNTEADAIKADIEQARAELAATTDALAAKFDVKANARKRRTALVVAAAVVVAAFVVRRVTR